MWGSNMELEWDRDKKAVKMTSVLLLLVTQ